MKAQEALAAQIDRLPAAPAVQDVPPDPAVLMGALHGAVHKDEGPENRGRLRLRSLKTEVPQ